MMSAVDEQPYFEHIDWKCFALLKDLVTEDEGLAVSSLFK